MHKMLTHEEVVELFKDVVLNFSSYYKSTAHFGKKVDEYEIIATNTWDEAYYAQFSSTQNLVDSDGDLEWSIIEIYKGDVKIFELDNTDW